MTADAATQLFVVPASSSLTTGGNLYNDGLLAHLPGLVPGCVRMAEDDPRLLAELARVNTAVWVDSLYLARIPELRRIARPSVRMHMLGHYLPSWVAEGDTLSAATLDDLERAALAALDGVLVPSSTMALLIERLRPGLATWVVPPALAVAAPQERPRASLCALMVNNLAQGKGVLPFLEALARQVRPSDRFELRIIGRVDADRSYAEACCGAIASSPELANRVRLVGAQPQSAVLSAMARAHVFVSASRMESFGMALCEARGAGMVVVALARGHVCQQVSAQAGGALVDDDDALANAFLTLVRDPEAREARLAAADKHRPRPRTSEQLAQEVALIARALEPMPRTDV